MRTTALERQWQFLQRAAQVDDCGPHVAQHDREHLSPSFAQK